MLRMRDVFKRVPHTKKVQKLFFLQDFAQIVNNEKLLTILVKMFHHRSLVGPYILFPYSK